VPNNASGKCECVPVPCEQGPFPTCNGPCPAGQVCRADNAGGQCVCGNVCQSTFPQCGGNCPPNRTCKKTTANCLCCHNGPPIDIWHLGWSSKTKLGWGPVPIDPCKWHVYRLTALKMTDADVNGVADFYGSCFAPDLELPEYDDLTPPPPAHETHFYLVTEVTGAGEGSMGNASNGAMRPNLAPCP
jgi:hypothetical protein